MKLFHSENRMQSILFQETVKFWLKNNFTFWPYKKDNGNFSQIHKNAVFSKFSNLNSIQNLLKRVLFPGKGKISKKMQSSAFNFRPWQLKKLVSGVLLHFNFEKNAANPIENMYCVKTKKLQIDCGQTLLNHFEKKNIN